MRRRLLPTAAARVIRTALLAVAALLAAGCFDFHALGNVDAAASLPPDLAGLMPPDRDAGGCGCGDGYNCIDDSCLLAPATCSALQAMFTPPSVPKDGVYWLVDGARSLRAYCDMRTGQTLCTNSASPTPEAHNTRTRDGSNISVNWLSVMSADEGSCSIWNVHADDLHPFGPLVANGKSTMTTCQALGFVADQYVPGCPYGKSHTTDADGGTCGFKNGDWEIYFNNCAQSVNGGPGCASGGVVATWQLEGPMSNTTVISSADGGRKTVCTTR